jgi:GT2 family glycosyltransferase
MKEKNHPLCSIVVLSWNTISDTKACIDSINKLTYASWELIVLDNGSNDGSKDYLSKLKGIKYIDLPENMGFTGGQIEAYKKSEGEYIVLVNSDAVVSPDWLDVVIETFESDSMIAAVGGRAYSWNTENKPFDESKGFYSYQVTDFVQGFGRTSQTGVQKIEVDSISGAVVAIKKSVIDEVGYFDNRFFAYYEETDLFARFKRAGYKIVYQPKAKAWHQIGKSSSGKPFFYLYQMQRNRFLYCFKNFDMQYLGRFVSMYLINGIKSSVKYVYKKDIESKAISKAMFWNMANIIRTIIDRKDVQKLGPTYNHHTSDIYTQKDITVIITCYNYAKYVGIAIDSVLEQKHQPFKIIVINDGSTDKSMDVINKYKDRVTIIDKNNSGVVDSKNLGISMIETTWTIFLDADDELPNNYLEELIKTAMCGKSDVIYCDMRYIGAKSDLIKAGEHSPSRLIRGNYIHNSVLIRTDSLKEIKGYKMEMKEGYEDWELYLSLLETGSIFEYCKKTQLFYRQHPNNHSESRNIVARQKSEHLHQVVIGLHPKLMKKYSSTSSKSIYRLSKVTKYPEFIYLVPIYFIRSALGVIRFYRINFTKDIKHRVMVRISNHIKSKNIVKEDNHVIKNS